METYGDSLAALADPTRRRLLEALGAGPKPVVELARSVPVSRPAVSQHLKVLKRAGLVVDERVGNRRLYRVDPGGLERLRSYLDRLWDDALAGFTDAAEGRGKGRTT